MKKQLMMIALAVGFMLPAKAQIVQTMKLENGSILHGYMKSQKPGSSCTFHAEEAVVVLDGTKVKTINGKKVAYNSLPEEWKLYADENGTLWFQQCVYKLDTQQDKKDSKNDIMLFRVFPISDRLKAEWKLKEYDP